VQGKLNRFWITLLLVAFAGLCWVGAISDHVQAKPIETKAETSDKEGSLSAAELCKKGFEQAFQGDFDQALISMQKAKKLDDDAQSITEAIKLITAYTSDKTDDDSQRKAEYNAAVQRVTRCMMVMDYLPKLTESETGEQFHEKVQ